ncbi:MAG: ABC transporter permease [Bacteroidota bacterium]
MTGPPRILEWLLERLSPESRPDLKGDFLELYDDRATEKGRSFANRKLLRDILSIIPLKFIVEEKRNKPVAMFSTNLKIARRNLVKNKMYTAINIVGLSVSLTICILITLFVRDELSFDKHFEGGEKIYRIAGSYAQGGADRVQSAMTTYLVKPLIENDVDGLETITRADFTWINVVIDDKQFVDNRTVIADSTFFDVFRMPFVKGDVNTALDRPENVVLDVPTAIKLFGTDDVLGKTIEVEGMQFVVTGVFEPFPVNTHFEARIILPISAAKKWYADWILHNASGTSLYTYIRTKDNFSVAGFEAAISKQIEKRWGWKGDGVPKYFLQPLTSIHLTSNLEGEIDANGSMITVYIFSITAIVIFILACINYVNLTTAASFQRGKEVGMKKVLGSTTRMQLSQFQTESFIVAIIAMILAMVMSKLAIPIFNQLSGKTLDFNPFVDPLIGPALLLVLIFVGLLAGAAPALVLLRTSTIGMLTDKLALRSERSYLRSGLIVFQFSISITLIACTLIVMDQISFIRKADLGIDPQSVVLVPIQAANSKYELLKTELMRNPNVISVSASSNKTTERVGSWRQYKTDPSQAEEANCPSTVVSYDFFETMKSQTVEGRMFSKEHSTDRLLGYVLNESAVKFLGLTDPVGKSLMGTTFTGNQWFRRNGTIIGVVKDFHYASLHDKVDPIVFYIASEETEGLTWMEVRINSENMTKTIESMGIVWKSVVGELPFHFEFMDDAVAAHYQAEDRFLKIFSTFSALSIMLGGLGLFGLTAFMAKRRTKEIGIRRVMGASVPTLIRIMSADFLQLVLVANVIGWPIAYYLMDKWMANFAYHAPISVVIFIATALAVLLIAFLCVLYHSLKVSRVNPVKSLRSE